MVKRIAIIQGHPDPRAEHFCHALADSYTAGAEEAGHEVRRVQVARLHFPMLTSKLDWETGDVPEPIRQAQDVIAWASHLVIIYPLWLGSMPAVLKAFFEQLARPGFAVPLPGERASPGKLLKGRSARVVVTMGMPAFLYRCYFRAHSLRSLERNILGFVGIGPIRSSLVGLVEGNAKRRNRWLKKMYDWGGAAR